jgi:hypothetical protein
LKNRRPDLWRDRNEIAHKLPPRTNKSIAELRKRIPTTVVDLEQIVRGEAAENRDRKNFTPLEAVALKRTLEPLLKAAAKERQ